MYLELRSVFNEEMGVLLQIVEISWLITLFTLSSYLFDPVIEFDTDIEFDPVIVAVGLMLLGN